MGNAINIGIDLGTTNSAIAKFIQGEVQVFNNPLDFGRSTLPSVVSYHKDKILVGSQAKVLLGKSRANSSSFAFFKRKMGTSESFAIKSMDASITPIELSAHVLKELKNFLPSGEMIDAAVITIPASFDLIQSNATKEAGKQAGFSQVVLLQEPIAASLAYANKKKNQDIKNGSWLVYDFGGGTFDAALVSINDGEMKILDHEGNNFLGGTDIDQLIIDKFVVPRLEQEYHFSNLSNSLKSAKGKLNGKYYVLLNHAEEAKIKLSATTSAEIVVDGFTDDNDEDVDFEVTITRSEFNELIKSHVDATIDMIKSMLTRNSIRSSELQFVLMVGGSTYIPYVRSRVSEMLNIPANCDIDPTTAVAVGAAYYAGTKQREIIQKDAISSYKISIKTSYYKASKEAEELFSAKISGNVDGLFYKIIRQDGGYDSGLKALKERISEDLPLVENSYNFFNLSVYDSSGNSIETDVEPIGINSGFGISGQPLPEDICLEVDDLDNPGNTKLFLLFQRNTTLPAKRTVTFPLNKTILKGSKDQIIKVSVLQGAHLSIPESIQTIGYIEINGSNLTRDISKGSDIEITISISDSQDLTATAYLTMADQEFQETFKPKTRSIPIKVLLEQVSSLSQKIDAEHAFANESEDFEAAAILQQLTKEIDSLVVEAELLAMDDVTDKRYQIEDRKRKIAQSVDLATKNKKLNIAKEKYSTVKTECFELVSKSGNDHEAKQYKEIVDNESAFLCSNNPKNITDKAEELDSIAWRIRFRNPEYLVNLYSSLLEDEVKMRDPVAAKSHYLAGKNAIENRDWDRLREINFALVQLLPNGSKHSEMSKIGFGL